MVEAVFLHSAALSARVDALVLVCTYPARISLRLAVETRIERWPVLGPPPVRSPTQGRQTQTDTSVAGETNTD